MARYSEELRDLMKNEEVMLLINKALSTYPIYTKRSNNEFIPNIIPTRDELNTKILNAYKYREIGFETVGRFLDELEITMCEIMPYYNQLMFSADQDYNIIFNVNYTKSTERDRETDRETNVAGSDSVQSNGSSSTNTKVDLSQEQSQTSNEKVVKSDTPQDSLNIGTKSINSVNYASEAGWKENVDSEQTEQSETHTGSGTTSNTTSGTNEVESTGNEKEVERILTEIKGNYGQVSAQSLIEHYREIIVNIEQKIINDRRLKELFMWVY